MSPRYQTLGPGESTSFGIAVRPPVYIVPSPLRPIPSELFPGNTVEADFDRLDILARHIVAGEPVPEIKPVFLGLRKFITEARIYRAQEQLQADVARDEVVRHIGESILQGNNPNKPDDTLRPVRWRDRHTAHRLFDIFHRRNIKQTRASHIAHSHHGAETGTADHGRLSLPERMNKRKSSKQYNKLMRGNPVLSVGEGRHKREKGTEQLDEAFAHIIGGSTRSAERHTRKRATLIAKSEGIDRALPARDARRARLQQRRAAARANAWRSVRATGRGLRRTGEYARDIFPF
ncbi:MAG TPA: hypothetical protein VJJ78_01670 [Candidatus Saccharimonadales bacterium]|nr:hypothetical protein [Candidatus Saccharimonadales bacterium]